VGVVGAEQKQPNRHAKKELFGGRVLRPVVDLFPHVEVVKGAAIELEGHAADVMEHEVRAKHVRDICQSP